MAALVLSRLAAPAPVVAERGPQLAVLRDRPYAVITLLNGILMLYMPLLSIVVPLWIVQRTSAPRWMVAALLIRFADRWFAEHPGRPEPTVPNLGQTPVSN